MSDFSRLESVWLLRVTYGEVRCVFLLKNILCLYFVVSLCCDNVMYGDTVKLF